MNYKMSVSDLCYIDQSESFFFSTFPNSLLNEEAAVSYDLPDAGGGAVFFSRDAQMNFFFFLKPCHSLILT